MSYVLEEQTVEPAHADGDTATTRVMATSEHLEQRIVSYAPGRSRERRLERRQEVLFVVSGTGAVAIDGRRHELEPYTGVYLAPGDTYVVDNPGPDELKVVSVTAPEERSARPGERRTVRYEDQPVLPASPNREFRYLVNQDIGCPDVTQFVGIIPPGRAGLHSHTYDEVVYVIDGEGILHFRGTETPLRPGSCLHLPPLEEHALENTGERPMQVLGVFHPSGDPASRASEAAMSNM
jgi:mannose-6-phosphate isomerase-like protein (cupin superfamily)